MDTTQILNKLDKIEAKLDSHLERIAVVEERQKGQAGHIKVIFSLITAGLSAIITWFLSSLNR